MARETEASDWAWRAANACATLEIARDGGEAGLIREVHELLSSAPAPIIAALGLPCSKARIEDLLALGAPREAAFQLLGRAVYMVSRSGAGKIKATVVAGDVMPEVSAEGPSEAIAICGALTEGFRDWAERNAMSATRLRRTH